MKRSSLEEEKPRRREIMSQKRENEDILEENDYKASYHACLMRRLTEKEVEAMTDSFMLSLTRLA